MPNYLHRTNRTTNSAPSALEIEEGEIGLNTSALGTAANGFNNGRLYIKLANGEIKRFIGLGLPGTTDATLKTKYGGTNNNFSTLSAPSVTNSKNLLFINYDANNNHSIQSVANNTLSWDNSTNRLSINRSTTPLSTLDVGGDVRIQTLSSWTSQYSSAFSVVGWNSSDEKLYRIQSNQFMSYVPDNTIPYAKMSGVLGLNKGGTGSDLVNNQPINGGLFFYDNSSSSFLTNNNLSWSNASNSLTINGNIIYGSSPTDTTSSATLLGINASNQIVKITSNNSNNYAFTTISASQGTAIVASGNNETVSLVAGDGLLISSNNSTKTITFTNTANAIPTVDNSSLFGNITIDRTTNPNKYFFFDPNGVNRNVFLEVSGVIEGTDVIIRNTETNNNDNVLNIYNGTTTGVLLRSLHSDYGDGYTDRTVAAHCVFDGTSWRIAMQERHYAPYPVTP